MEVRHVYMNGKVKVSVERDGIVLSDYSYSDETVDQVERRLVSTVKRLTLDREVIA